MSDIGRPFTASAACTVAIPIRPKPTIASLLRESADAFLFFNTTTDPQITQIYTDETEERILETNQSSYCKPIGKYPSARIIQSRLDPLQSCYSMVCSV